ncbi:hypothetical protein CRENPOLYSF1_190005 [Crenothrix polyspora]|uniref:Uncharacterized protein n=1 Tax=Crenothrix polyspora TaxID=360316 RepID=A0A1R4H4W4_9GAMM|nr:hypothetical protein CRENPOLYSF1_190005 [Crenothrix polyspora]
MTNLSNLDRLNYSPFDKLGRTDNFLKLDSGDPLKAGQK